MKIAVDAMGGDYAPTEVVTGAYSVAKENPAIQIFLVGDQDQIDKELSSQGTSLPNIIVRHAPEVIAMDDHPAQALRKKRSSSLVIAGQMVKLGEADATISMGNTGAAMAIATVDIGRIVGVDRPAIATLLPTLKGRALLLDAGANVDCSPQNLMQFALLGSIYAEKVLGVSQPKIGLLNIGGEAGKGNELTKAAYELLAANGAINFYGNVEGKDVYEHATDVVVCDGFAGNILLKSSEGVAELMVALLQREMHAHPETENIKTMFGPIFQRLVQLTDYAEYGGAPLLGVNGVSFIGHGRSKAKAIANGIVGAARAASSGYVDAIREAFGSEGNA